MRVIVFSIFFLLISCIKKKKVNDNCFSAIEIEEVKNGKQESYNRKQLKKFGLQYNNERHKDSIPLLPPNFCLTSAYYAIGFANKTMNLGGMDSYVIKPCYAEKWLEFKEDFLNRDASVFRGSGVRNYLVCEYDVDSLKIKKRLFTFTHIYNDTLHRINKVQFDSILKIWELYTEAYSK